MILPFCCDRIRCIAKVRPLFLQLEPMRTLAEQLKKDRDLALNKVTILEEEMDKVITKIQVQLCPVIAVKYVP